MFPGAGDVIRAMASGNVQMGEAGSRPLTAAASQGQDTELFWISADIADDQALVARNGSPWQAGGKRCSTGFGRK